MSTFYCMLHYFSCRGERLSFFFEVKIEAYIESKFIVMLTNITMFYIHFKALEKKII